MPFQLLNAVRKIMRKNLTLRYPAKMMLDGSALRITLDNFCGNEPVHLTRATVAVSDGADGILPETLVPLTFSGNAGVTIPAGERLQSDAAAFPVEKGTTIAVSLYFAEFTEMRSGVVITGPLSGGYFAVGDQTANAVLDTDTSKKTHTVYFLSDIDVLTAAENRTLICFGDSITAQAWPDYLMERTLQCGDGTTAVIRKAASGTRILRQYDNITYDSYGLKGETRFPREISGCRCRHGADPARHQRYYSSGGNRCQPVPSVERPAHRGRNDRGAAILYPYCPCQRTAGVHGNAAANRGLANLCGLSGKAAERSQPVDPDNRRN